MIEQASIKDIAQFIKTGKTPPSKMDKYFNGDLNWYTPGDLDKGKLLGKSNRTLTEVAFLEGRAVTYPKDTLLVGCIGDIGKLGITTRDSSSNQQITGIYPNKTADVHYLYYWFRGNKKVVESYSNNAVVPILNNRTLERIKIPLPPLEEQKQIAAILDAADELRQKDKALIAKYDELTQSLFLDMFGDTVTNPKGWDSNRAKDLCLKIVDCVNKTAPSVDQQTDYKMIRTTNVRNNMVDLNSVRYVSKEVFLKWNRRLTPQKGDVVFTREAPVGEAGIIWFLDKVFLGQRTMIYRVNPQRVNNIYLLYQLMGAGVKRQISKLSMGSTVKHLAVPTCEVFNILTPPILLQNEFAQRVQSIDSQKAIAQESLNKSEALFNSLLQKAFKGELTN